MTDKLMKIPEPDHPISIDANRFRVVVKVDGKVIADTSEALTFARRPIRPFSISPVGMSIWRRSYAANTPHTVLQGRRLLQHSSGRRSLAQCSVDL
jgi:hypothetical protein